MSEKSFLMRSLMFVPGHNLRLLESASKSEADVLLIDLEDSVQPVSNKQVARDQLLQYIDQGKLKNYLLFPRINDRASGELLRDVNQLSVEGITGFMYPKATTAGDIYFIDKLLETIEYEKGLTPGKFKLLPLIETAAAVLNAQEIIQASERVVGIAFGCEDFIQDLEGIHDDAGASIYVPRALIAMAARANNVIPIDTVHIKVHDLVDLKSNLEIAKKLGYEGMLVLHPKEIESVHAAFTPSAEEIEDAQQMLQLNKEAQENDMGVALMKGKFIGPPFVAAAEKVIKKHQLIKKIQERKR